jgi:hypothetical protein
MTVVKTCLCMFQLAPVMISHINANCEEVVALIICVHFYVSLQK